VVSVYGRQVAVITLHSSPAISTKEVAFRNDVARPVRHHDKVGFVTSDNAVRGSQRIPQRFLNLGVTDPNGLSEYHAETTHSSLTEPERNDNGRIC
jgi:hypothetical protein